LSGLEPEVGGESFVSAEAAELEDIGTLVKAGWSEDYVRVGTNETAETHVVPPVKLFEGRWRLFTKNGVKGMTMLRNRKALEKAQKLEDKPVKFVMGIFTTNRWKDEAYRAAIRRTWMTQSWVCQIDDILDPPGDCQIFVAFVVGKDDSIPPKPANHTVETDIVALDEKESMNCGKTRAWFAYASDEYDMATHIGKMDMDAYVDVHGLLGLLQAFTSKTDCHHVYGGRPWHCPQDFCPKMKCGGPNSTDYYSYRNGDPNCWTYMQGGFYFMSRNLASSVAEEGGWWHTRSSACLAEDAITGKAVDLWGRQRKECVATLDLRGQEVIWHPDKPDFWISSWYRPE